MRQLPIFLNLSGRTVVLVGEGEAADAKARLIARAGGRVVPAWEAGATIAFVALEEGAETVAADLRARGLLVNVVDRPEECDFIVPSIVRRGDVTIAISTSGILPMASKKIRQSVEETMNRDWVAYVRIIGAVRRYLLKTVADKAVRRSIMRYIGSMDREEIVKTGTSGMKRVVKSRIP